MKTFLIGAVAAVGLALGVAASDASAYWVTRTSLQWDPYIGDYVAVQQRVWVPDPVIVESPVVVPAPVVVRPVPAFRVGPAIVRPVPAIGPGPIITRPVPPARVGIGIGIRF